MDLVFFFLSISTFNIVYVRNWALSFFYLIFIKLFWSYNSGRKFNKLAHVDLFLFLSFF